MIGRLGRFKGSGITAPTTFTLIACIFVGLTFAFSFGLGTQTADAGIFGIRCHSHSGAICSHRPAAIFDGGLCNFVGSVADGIRTRHANRVERRVERREHRRSACTNGFVNGVAPKESVVVQVQQHVQAQRQPVLRGRLFQRSGCSGGVCTNVTAGPVAVKVEVGAKATTKVAPSPKP